MRNQALESLLVILAALLTAAAGVWAGSQNGVHILISPVFVYLLLTRGSGIPMAEPRADARWGDDPKYRDYKAHTPVLFPRPPA